MRGVRGAPFPGLDDGKGARRAAKLRVQCRVGDRGGGTRGAGRGDVSFPQGGEAFLEFYAELAVFGGNLFDIVREGLLGEEVDVVVEFRGQILANLVSGHGPDNLGEGVPCAPDHGIIRLLTMGIREHAVPGRGKVGLLCELRPGQRVGVRVPSPCLAANESIEENTFRDETFFVLLGLETTGETALEVGFPVRAAGTGSARVFAGLLIVVFLV